MIDLCKSTPQTYNNLAWLHLFPGGSLERGIELALRSVTQSAFANDNELHTLAALYAEAGKTGEALQALRQAIDLRGGDLTRHDWYVIGRVAEDYELFDVAKASYSKVTRDDADRDQTDTYWLAAKRLEQIEKRK